MEVRPFPGFMIQAEAQVPQCIGLLCAILISSSPSVLSRTRPKICERRKAPSFPAVLHKILLISKKRPDKQKEARLEEDDDGEGEKA